MKWLRHNAIVIYGGLAIAYMLIPIAVIAVFSFNDPTGKFNFTWQGFTFEHWENAFGIEELNEALTNSLQLAVLSTIVATLLGTLIALALVRYEFRGRKATNLLIVIPMATPEVVIGASLLSMFVYAGVGTGFDDSPHRPHHVLHLVRRRRRSLAARSGSTEASRRRPPTSERRP